MVFECPDLNGRKPLLDWGSYLQYTCLSVLRLSETETLKFKQYLAGRDKEIVKRWPPNTIGDAHVFDKAKTVLEQRPKYAAPSRLDDIDKVSLVRAIASKAHE